MIVNYNFTSLAITRHWPLNVIKLSRESSIPDCLVSKVSLALRSKASLALRSSARF